MSDTQKALTALNLLHETCMACIDTLQAGNPPPTELSVPSLPTLRKDLMSLLTLIYTSTTKVSLSLRPSEPAFKASLAPLQDLTKYVSSLTTCAILFDTFGATFAEEVRQAAKGVTEHVKALAHAFVNITEKGEAASEDYLIRTGAVHDSIEEVRNTLSTDNLSAVLRRWTGDKDMLEDSVNEVQEMTQNGGNDTDNGSEDEGFGSEEDEWAELGFGESKKLSEVEVARVKDIIPLLQMVHLLHKRVRLDLLKQPHLAPGVGNKHLDALPGHSHNLLLAIEEIVAVLYAPQNPSAIRSALTTLVSVTEAIQKTLLEGTILPPPKEPSNGTQELEKKMMNVSVSGNGKTAKKEKDVRKWFDTCFIQIGKLSDSCSGRLENEVSSNTP